MGAKLCAYCGSNQAADRDHVIPKSLYPQSKRPQGSDVQLITVPVCKACHLSFPDETHFRQVVVVAGPPNAAVLELWDGPVARSICGCDGPRRVDDLFRRFHYAEVPGGRRTMIYPAEDESVLGTTRKIIRGLCAHFGLGWAVPDEDVLTDVLRFVVPPEILEAMTYWDCQADIFSCRCQLMHGIAGMHSAWLLTFFGRTTFTGIVADRGTAGDEWRQMRRAQAARYGHGAQP